MIIKLNLKPKPKYYPAVLLSYGPKILLALLIFVVISYFYFDRAISLYFHNDNTSIEKMANKVSALINPAFLLIALPILYFLNKLFWKNAKLQEPLKLLVFALPFSFAVTKLCKLLLSRDRPKRLFIDGTYGFQMLGNGDFSFPSGHACVVGAIVGSLACFMPKYTWLLFFAGILISFSRVIAGDHFLSDVVAGAVLGALMSQLLYMIMKKQKFLF
ncbi:MAG: phosphatase PAP2 family protein [Chlamydiae bacterium]|nr:phosphatase PAP2 family protein [Chlamydiota bacterium]